MTGLRAARGDLHAQSYGKQVTEVTTLLETATPRHEDARSGVPTAAVAALAATRVGDRLGPDQPVEERALAAAVEAVRVRRFAPADRYPVHRAYPSPRGLFGADVHLSGADWALRVDPHDGLLRGPTPAVGDATRLGVTAHPDRYPTPYGALRDSLALLEAGHLTATLALTATRAGLAPGVDFGTHDGTVARVRLDGGPTHVDAAAVAALDAAAAPSVDRLDAWLDRRTSGWSHENLVTSRPVPAELTAGVEEALQRALAALADVIPPDGVRLYRHRLVDDSMTHREAQRLDMPEQTRPLDGEASFLSATGCTLTANLEAWLDRYGADATVVLHTALGFAAQWACLAGAAGRLTVRPARNFDEAVWGAALALPVQHTVAYQLWLRAWPPGGDERTAWSMLGVSA